MPSYVSRSVRTGLDELELLNWEGGVTDNLRWYNFRGDITIQPAARLIDLCRAAQANGLKLILSNWDFNQSFKFERSGELQRTLDELPTIEAMFQHIADVMLDSLELIDQHDLLDVIWAVEITNELESPEIGPLSRLGTDSQEGPKGTEAGARQHLHEVTRPMIEECIEQLRSRFPELKYAVDTVWPWADSSAPTNLDLIAINGYITDTALLGDYRALFSDGDVWQGDVLDEKVRHLLLPDAPSYRAWREGLGTSIRDPYFPQCYLATWADPDRFFQFFDEVWRRAEDGAKSQMQQWIREATQLSSDLDVPWYFGEGYATTISLTSLWDSGSSARDFHRWVAEQLRAAGAIGWTPSSAASPEQTDIWPLEAWVKDMNALVRA